MGGLTVEWAVRPGEVSGRSVTSRAVARTETLSPLATRLRA
ncbi:hypothetical protein J2751_001244 [Halorubrum alkaliphilum]|uniref:Uncharacterized protein n=1 Tax=Halorubrum alkaliphilum TaxID=261290 RepID=A0A8T4GCR9_9EURY|nr:hypothetical protein [Halorubrum alkaliphilum]MBP1922238.1 hypothetical protein [Halorubrum alkaliphilum]